MEVSGFANAFRNRLAFPFLFGYLHNVRGFPLPTVSLIAGTSAAVGIASIPLAGIIVDRIGGKRTLVGSLVLLAIGFGGYAFVHEPWRATAGAVVGIEQRLLAEPVGAHHRAHPPARRHASFALQRVMRNLGLGLGGVAGGRVATTENATSYLGAVRSRRGHVSRLRARARVRPRPRPVASGGGSAGALPRGPLRNRIFLAVVGLNVVYVAAGYALLEVFPVFAKNETGVTERQIGFIFFVNTLAIVLAQLPVRSCEEQAPDAHGLALATFVWAGAWLMRLRRRRLPREAGAAALVFELATDRLRARRMPSRADPGALVADLAPRRLRGRYARCRRSPWGSAASLLIGPTSAGFILHAAPNALWPIAAVTCVLAGCSALLLERRIPPELRVTPS